MTPPRPRCWQQQHFSARVRIIPQQRRPCECPPRPPRRARPTGRLRLASMDRVAREVRHELVMLPYYGVFDNLTFHADGGECHFNGQVTRPTLKSDAENVVRRNEGVDRVFNDIQVLPLSPNDDRLRVSSLPASTW